MSRITLPTALITAASLVAAGWLAGLNKEAPPHEEQLRLGQSIEVDPGQTITPLTVSYGQFIRNPLTKDAMISADRLVALQLKMSTRGPREATGVRCIMKHPDGSTSEAVAGDVLSFPDAGFAENQSVVFDVAITKLGGSIIDCASSGVITYREAHLLLDLNLTIDTLPEVLRTSAYKTAEWPESVLEVVQ